MMRNECFSDGFFEGMRWATTWTETYGTEYGENFVDGIKSELEAVTLGYAVDVNMWNEGFVYGARQVARDFVRYGAGRGISVSAKSETDDADRDDEPKFDLEDRDLAA